MEIISINDRFTVEVHDYSSEGAGVARLENGCAVFIDDAVRGDICEIAITKVMKRVCHAEIMKIKKPSEHRIPVDCSVFGECGGCDYRHISYEEELYAKRKRVSDALRRIGGVTIELEDILTTGKINGYRNNIQLKTDGQKIGFYSKSSRNITEIDECLLASEEANTVIRQRRISGKIRTSTETLGDLTFRISPDSFFQVNTGAALLLYEKAREYAALKPHEFLLDLYCGTGSITLFLGRDAGKALGVELNAAAIDDARENAVLNNISNVDFLCADASLLGTSGLKPDCIVADPPRRGLSSDVLRKIGELMPERIIYISCDAGTMARDIKLLENYEVRRACAVDLFPRTRHVECIVKLTRTSLLLK
jgi:tRNA/tmRNA/rRNA uracil-C5-methylase (TrmA/RlmC/RlmD family)